MAAPEGYTKLGNVGYADKGVYSADATYNKYNVVYYEGSTYVALKDNLHGVTPANGENWRYMAKGFNEASADGITVIDTSGIIDGTKNKKTILQTFLDKVGDFIINKAVTNEALLLKLADYVAKTDIVQTESTATDKVPSSAYLKQALGTINSNLNKRVYYSNSVIALQSPVVNNVTYRFQVDSRSGGVILYKSEDNGLNWERDKEILSNADYEVQTITNSYGINIHLIRFGNDNVKVIRLSGYINKALTAGTEYIIATNAALKSRIDWYHNVFVSGKGSELKVYLNIDKNGNVKITPHTAIASGLAINMMEYYV